MHKISSLEDMKTIEESLRQYKRSLQIDENNINDQENKICEQTNSTWNLRRQNEQNSKYKLYNEVEQNKISDTCQMYDNLMSENLKLRSEHQN